MEISSTYLEGQCPCQAWRPVHMVVKGKGTYEARGCEPGARPMNSDSVPTMIRPDPTVLEQGSAAAGGRDFQPCSDLGPTLIRPCSK